MRTGSRRTADRCPPQVAGGVHGVERRAREGHSRDRRAAGQRADRLQAGRFRRSVFVDRGSARDVDPPERGARLVSSGCLAVFVVWVVVGRVELEVASRCPHEGQRLEPLADVRIGRDVVVSPAALGRRLRVDDPQVARVGVVVAARLAEQNAVGPHRQIAVTVGAVQTADIRHRLPGEGVDGPQPVAAAFVGGDEQNDVAQRERHDVRAERGGVVDVQNSVGLDRIDLHRTAAVAGREAAEPDVVFDDPLDRIDRFEADVGIGGAAREGLVEFRRERPVRRHRHVVDLVGGRHVDRADERVERAERAAAEVVAVESRPGLRARLVVLDVRIAADEDQPPGRVVDGQHRVGPRDAVGVVDVEHGRPGLAAGVHPADRLNLLEVDLEAVPVDVARGGDAAGHADRVDVALQQVAQVLGAGLGVVVGGRLARLGGEDRVGRLAVDLDAVGGVADVGVADRRARLLVDLPQAQLELIVAGGAVLAGDADEVGAFGAHLPGQNHVHARIALVGCVEVAAEEDLLRERAGRAAEG